MPEINESFGKLSIPYDSRDVALSLIVRWRATKLNIERLTIDRDFLTYEVESLRLRLRQLDKQARFATAERKVCHFCKCRISASAHVCHVCRRAQPSSYEVVARRDAAVRLLVEAKKHTSTKSPAQNQGQCCFCFTEVVLATVLCPVCGMIQPGQVAELITQDVAAVKVIVNAQKAGGGVSMPEQFSDDTG